MRAVHASTFWETVTELLSDRKLAKRVETCAKPYAVEMNPYSGRFGPAKYFAYSRKAARTTTLIIAEDNEAVIKIVKH